MKRGTKRKIKKFVSNNTYALFFIAVFSVLGFMTTGYALLKSTGTLNGLAEIIASSEPSDPEDSTEACSTEIGVEITTGPWTEGADVQKAIYKITITNDSSEKYYNWKMRMPAADIVSVDTAHVVVENTGEYLYLSSYSWNGEIEPGASYSFEISATSSANMETLFDSLIVTTCGRATENKEVITDGNASIELGQQEVKLDVSFGSGTQLGTWGGIANLYEVVLTNNTEYNVSDFRALIYYGPSATLNNAYPVTKTNDDSANYILEVSNTASGNAQIAPGASFTFTLVLNTSDATFYPDIVAAGLKEISQ